MSKQGGLCGHPLLTGVCMSEPGALEKYARVEAKKCHMLFIQYVKCSNTSRSSRHKAFSWTGSLLITSQCRLH